MRAREGVQNIALPPLLERVCAAPAAVLQGSLGHIVMVGWGLCLLLFHPYLAGRTLHLVAAARGLGSVLAAVLWVFLTCLWPGQVPRQVVLVLRHVIASCAFVRMCS